MFSQSLPAFPAPESSGFFAVPSVASASAFVGIEGTAKNGVCGLVSMTALRGLISFFRYSNEYRKKGGFLSCSVSTTAIIRHKCR